MLDPARFEIPRLIAAVLIVIASACGGTDIGESCDDEGSTDECVDDAVCTNESGERAVCRGLCEEHEDCPDAHSCNGVTGSNLKSCQPDDD